MVKFSEFFAANTDTDLMMFVGPAAAVPLVYLA